MAEGLTGNVTMPKEAFGHDLLNREAATRKSAALDLWLWANDRQRSFTAGGGRKVTVQRGQLAYSIDTLARLWRWGRDKTKAVLVEFQEEGLITFETSNTTTIITVLDYAIYNPDTTPDPKAEPDAEPTPETESDPKAEPIQKVEGRSKKIEGGRDATAEIPPESELADFCAGYRNLALGIELGIPEMWWTGWVANQLANNRWPARWRDALLLAHRSDWLNTNSPGHAKAHGWLTAKPLNGLGVGKNGAKKSGEVSASVQAVQDGARRREIQQRLRELDEEIEPLRGTGSEVELVREDAELRRELAGLGVAA